MCQCSMGQQGTNSAKVHHFPPSDARDSQFVSLLWISTGPLRGSGFCRVLLLWCLLWLQESISGCLKGCKVPLFWKGDMNSCLRIPSGKRKTWDMSCGMFLKLFFVTYKIIYRTRPFFWWAIRTWALIPNSSNFKDLLTNFRRLLSSALSVIALERSWYSFSNCWACSSNCALNSEAYSMFANLIDAILALEDLWSNSPNWEVAFWVQVSGTTSSEPFSSSAFGFFGFLFGAVTCAAKGLAIDEDHVFFCE